MLLSDEQIEICKSIPIEQVATALGYHVKRIGRYQTLEEIDSIRINQDTNTYCRWSTKEGGSSIDFLMKVESMSFREATEKLLDMAGHPLLEQQSSKTNLQRTVNRKEREQSKTVLQKEEEKEPFKLPKPSVNSKRMYGYLTQKRKLSSQTVQFFHKRRMIYEEAEKHNIVFKSLAPDGTCHHASMHGTYSVNGEKTFRGDVSGSEKKYGFNLAIPSEKENGKTALYVFEAPIDMMSFCELFGVIKEPENYEGSFFLAQNGTDLGPTRQFLENYKEKNITDIICCLDADDAGRNAFVNLVVEYGHKYHIDSVFPFMKKDWNECLCEYRASGNHLDSVVDIKINALDQMKKLIKDGNVQGLKNVLKQKVIIDIDASDNEGTILHYACKYAPHMVQTLIENGCNKDAKNEKGRTPVSIACESGYKTAIMALHKAGADTQLRDNSGKRPSEYFTRYKQEPSIEKKREIQRQSVMKPANKKREEISL